MVWKNSTLLHQDEISPENDQEICYSDRALKRDKRGNRLRDKGNGRAYKETKSKFRSFKKSQGKTGTTFSGSK